MTDPDRPKHPGGRPSEYSQEIADTICERLACGESLRSICLDEEFPNKSTVLRWLARGDRPDFRDQYARAREIQADVHFDDIIDIADDGSNDWMERHDKNEGSGWALNGEHVQRSKLRIDARKWAASKLAPKKYGDRIVQEHTGADGGPIEIAKIERVIVKPEDPDA